MLRGDVPQIDQDANYEKNKQWYEENYGILFLEDPWSLWHIRVWANARTSNGFGVTIESDVVFRYASKYRMDDIETLELIKNIERGASSAKES